MSFEYVSFDEAVERRGLRMIVVSGVPSPWGEAAKGLFHMKGIDWAAVRLTYDDEKLAEWSTKKNGPVAVYENEPPRSGWAEILLLAERLAPTPALLPNDPAERALVFGIAHEICGEGGLGWSRRLQLVHAGLHGQGGFVEPVAKYLARKYGYRAGDAASYAPRVVGLLGMLADRLRSQRTAGSDYYVGASCTAVDVYGATVMALFAPLPPEQCAMDPYTRAAFETLDDETRAALDPILLEHRDRMYATHLALPLSL
jgi:glutathione S-transferase